MIRSLSQTGDLVEESSSQTRNLREDIQNFYNEEEEKKSVVEEPMHSNFSKSRFNYVSSNNSFTLSNDQNNEQSSIASDEVYSKDLLINESKNSFPKRE